MFYFNLHCLYSDPGVDVERNVAKQDGEKLNVGQFTSNPHRKDA